MEASQCGTLGRWERNGNASHSGESVPVAIRRSRVTIPIGVWLDCHCHPFWLVKINSTTLMKVNSSSSNTLVPVVGMWNSHHWLRAAIEDDTWTFSCRNVKITRLSCQDNRVTMDSACSACTQGGWTFWTSDRVARDGSLGTFE